MTVVLILLAPIASAWTLGSGTILVDDEGTTPTDDDTSILLKVDMEVDILTFDPAPVIDDRVLDFEPSSGTWAWNITNGTLPLNLTIEGNVSQGGTFRVTNFPGLYLVRGIFGMPDFLVQGPTFTLNIPPGNQTISITQLSGDAGLQILMDSDYYVEGTSIASTAALLSAANGVGLSGAAINHTIYRPDGSFLSAVVMEEGPIPGYYFANVTLNSSEPFGPYKVVASAASTLDTQTVIRETGINITLADNLTVTNLTFGDLNGMIETALDSWIPILIWGAVMLLCLWAEAWTPAVMAMLNVAVLLPNTPLWGRPASIMLFIIGLFLHVIIMILHRRNWFRETKEGGQ